MPYCSSCRPCFASPYSTKPSNGLNESDPQLMLTLLFVVSLLVFAYMLYVLIRPERF